MRSYRSIRKKIVKPESTPDWEIALIAADLKTGHSYQKVKEASSRWPRQRLPEIDAFSQQLKSGAGVSKGPIDFKLKPLRGEIEVCRCRRQETAPATLP
jgi:hypothetical protein